MDCQKLLVYGIILLLGMYILRDVCGINIAKVFNFEGNENMGEDGMEGMDNGLLATNSIEATNNPSNTPMNTLSNSINAANASAESVASANAAVNAIAMNAANSIATNAAAANAAAANAASANAAAANTASSNVGEGSGITASEPGDNTFNMPIQGIQTAPASCYPQNQLTPDDLLPEGSASEIQGFNQGLPEIGEGILKGINFLDAGFHIGINTIGQSLRNANLNLRAEPPNPRSQVSPWMNSTIDTDLSRRPLNDGECNLSPGQTLP